MFAAVQLYCGAKRWLPLGWYLLSGRARGFDRRQPHGWLEPTSRPRIGLRRLRHLRTLPSLWPDRPAILSRGFGLETSPDSCWRNCLGLLPRWGSFAGWCRPASLKIKMKFDPGRAPEPKLRCFSNRHSAFTMQQVWRNWNLTHARK